MFCYLYACFKKLSLRNALTAPDANFSSDLRNEPKRLRKAISKYLVSFKTHPFWHAFSHFFLRSDFLFLSPLGSLLSKITSKWSWHTIATENTSEILRITSCLAPWWPLQKYVSVKWSIYFLICVCVYFPATCRYIKKHELRVPQSVALYLCTCNIFYIFCFFKMCEFVSVSPFWITYSASTGNNTPMT